MIGRISSQIEYLDEAIVLLTHLAKEESFVEEKDNFIKKYAISKKVSSKFDLLIDIEMRAKEILQEEMESIKFYFQSGLNQANHLASYVLLYDTFTVMNHQIVITKREDVAPILEGKITNYIAQLSEKKYCNQFSKLLNYYLTSIIENDKEIILDTIADVIRFIMNMEIPIEEKWNLQDILLNTNKHIQTVVKVLEQTIHLLFDYEERIQACVDTFASYWLEKEKVEPFYKYVERAVGISLDDNPLGYVVQAGVFSLNSLGIHADTDNAIYITPTNYKLGILFDDEFTLSTKMQNNIQPIDVKALSIFKLLSDKSKFEILFYIKDKRAYGSELAKHLNLTTATISHHMSSLMQQGLVEMEKEEARVYYRMNKRNIENILQYLNDVLLS